MLEDHKTLRFLLLMVVLFGIIFIPMGSARPMDVKQPIPQVEIIAIEFSNTNPIEGQKVTISVIIKNNNTMSVDNLTLSLYIDYELVYNFTGISLRGGELSTFNYTWDSKYGTHNITAIIAINGVPLRNTIVSEELEVELGDVNTLVITLVVEVLVVLITVVIPSIWTIRGGKLNGCNSHCY